MYAVFGAFLFEQLERTNESAKNYDNFLNELWEIANKTHEGNETEAGKKYFKDACVCQYMCVSVRVCVSIAHCLSVCVSVCVSVC
ncbi:hypothetical protein scyTo_0000874 [Scyliorhinus torazame]|uniref:Uncharacterized protein n=1 Tax=Scyliorhinus torazame TaxID=75743 RepID=A0A401P5K3_SCYTO|nr:hypothetical protein [Scyliorhinus torazame]